MANIHIAGREIGPGSPSFVMAEVAQAHEGSLLLAHAYIDAVAEAGADAIKFQAHLAQHESTLDESFRVPMRTQDARRFDYWKRMEFSESQWRELADHAREREILFLVSAFSVEAVELLSQIGVPAWKVGSGELRNEPILEAMQATGVPILLSTGMARHDEIDASVAFLRERKAEYGLFQCTSRYPNPLDTIGLNLIDELRRRHDCPVGLSDHSGSLFPALAALARGADLLELHVVMDHRLPGPDASSSISVDELGVLVDARDAFELMDQHPVDKDAMADELKDVRQLFSRSLALRESLPAGTQLDASMLTTKKPGTGIPDAQRNELIGRRLARDVGADRLLRWEDLDES